MKKYWHKFVHRIKMDYQGWFFLRLYRLYRRGTISRITFEQISDDLVQKCINLSDKIHDQEMKEDKGS